MVICDFLRNGMEVKKNEISAVLGSGEVILTLILILHEMGMVTCGQE